jgi:hypothetical protein
MASGARDAFEERADKGIAGFVNADSDKTVAERLCPLLHLRNTRAL